MTADDLKSYSAVARTPVRGSYRGYDIVSMPLPSSGGTVLLESLNILEGFPMPDMTQGSARSLHVIIEAMKRAYADRARYLGDPLSSMRRRKSCSARITPPNNAPASILPARRRRPTHCCRRRVKAATPRIIRWSTAAATRSANTYTLNFPYGVGLVAEGTGVLLNNELDDFTAAPGASNAFGLVGFEANLPGPGKRPLSSMSPTIVLKEGKPVLVTGTPGGSRIISAVLQIVIDVLDYRMDVAAAVAAPRVHHQWLPDVVRVERGFPQETLDALKARGHEVLEPLGQTSANSIAVTPTARSALPIRAQGARKRRTIGDRDLPERGIGVGFALPRVNRPARGGAKAG